MALAGFADSLFGAGTLRPEDIELAPSAAAVPAFLQASYRPWREVSLLRDLYLHKDQLGR